MTRENSVIDPAKLAARLRAGQNRAFTGRAPLTVGEAAFKALRLDQVERVSLTPVEVVEAEWVEDPAPAEVVPEPAAPPPPDPAKLLVPVTQDSWRWMFLIGASPALLTFLIRLFVPESGPWEKARAAATRQDGDCPSGLPSVLHVAPVLGLAGRIDALVQRADLDLRAQGMPRSRWGVC